MDIRITYHFSKSYNLILSIWIEPQRKRDWLKIEQRLEWRTDKKREVFERQATLKNRVVEDYREYRKAHSTPSMKEVHNSLNKLYDKRDVREEIILLEMEEYKWDMILRRRLWYMGYDWYRWSEQTWKEI